MWEGHEAHQAVERLEARVLLSAAVATAPPRPSAIQSAIAADLEVLPAPVLSSTPCDAGQAMLAWTGASGQESGFDLDRSDDGGATFVPLVRLPTGANSYTDLGLDPQTTYEYQIKSLGDGVTTADSVFSNVVSVTPSGQQQTPSSQTILGGAGDDMIVLRRQQAGTLVDVWVNAPQSGRATQTADAAEPIVIQGMGGTDTVTLDNGNGNPLGVELDLNQAAGGSFTTAAATLTIPAGSSVKLSPGISRSGDRPALRLGGLSLDPTSSVNIGDNAVLVGSTVATLNGYLSAARITASGASSIGYSDRGDGSLLLEPTVFGDANLDGKVDFSDLLKLAQNYGTSAASWDRGDFTYDGKVDFSDLLKLAQNYGSTLLTRAGKSGTASPPLQSWLRPHRSRSTR